MSEDPLDSSLDGKDPPGEEMLGEESVAHLLSLMSAWRKANTAAAGTV